MTPDTTLADSAAHVPIEDRESVHPLWLRLMHWANASAIVLMIMSGWRIYDATNFLHIHTPVPTNHGVVWAWGIAPPYTLGGWLGGALQWHFAAMWILVINAVLYVIVSIVTKRFVPQFFPLTPKGFFHDFLQALKGHLSHADIRQYNSVQKAAYLFAMVDIIVLIISGCALWKSVQFAWARVLTFGYEPARYIHFTAMALLCGFIVVHVVMALLVPKTIKAMIWGAEMSDRKIPDDIKADKDAILREAAGLLKDPAKRRLFGNILTLGGLSIATGILIKDRNSIQNILNTMSKFNDGVQGTIFSHNSQAPIYPKSMINNPFRFNAFYGMAQAPVVDGSTYKLMLSGQINDKRPWTLPQLYALPGQISQVTRHICVEGWSEIGEWGGPQLSTFLKAVGADLTCKYVGFKCADGYYESIDMPTALHPQTLMAFTFREHTIPTYYGYPFKIRMPTKLGYKNPKSVMEIFVTNDFPGGYWVDKGYNWFGGS